MCPNNTDCKPEILRCKFKASAAAFVLVCYSAAGCVQEMANQPRYKPLAASSVFLNGAASRLPVAGTVARGELQDDDAFFLGKVNGQLVIDIPARALAHHTMSDLLIRGQDRFNIFCSHCHGNIGGGTGGSEEM